MINVFIKSIIILFLVLFFVRLMGKRQLGEMQPFELVITLIIAEVACIPMNDPYIPFYNGIIPIVTLATMHIVMTFIARKSMLIRRALSGRSVIVIDKDGINYENLKKLNININDLIEAVRSSGYADFNEIEYAIFETNGKLCVIEKWADPTQPAEALLPITLLIDGKWDEKNLNLAGVTTSQVTTMLKKKGIKNLKEVLYLDIRQNGMCYVSPKKDKYFTVQMHAKGGESW